MNFLKQLVADRRRADEQKVIAAIGMLRPSKASNYPISRLAGLNPGRSMVTLGRLERAGRVTSGWADGPYPRRRIYKVVKAAVTR